MAKRSREEASSLLPPQHAKQEKPTKLPAAKRCREPSVAPEAREKTRGSMEIWRTQPEANKVAGDPLSPRVATGGAPDPHVGGDVGTATTAATLPRWWQLWMGRGGGMVVDCEELLWGWFPFVDEDFASDAENVVEWFSIWGDDVVG